MAKKFTDNDKWKKPFLRSLKAPYKLLWLYILDECDHAGIWICDFEIAQIKIGEKVNLNTALDQFGDSIVNLGDKFFIPEFIEVQYGKVLKRINRVHNSVVDTLLPLGFLEEREEEGTFLLKNKELVSPFQGVKDKDKEKDKDKDKETKGGAGGKTEVVKPHLFRDNEFFPIELFKANIGDKYQFANLEYYHEAVSVWSDKIKDQKAKWKTDWLAVARGFILRDKQEGKLQLAKGQPTEKQQVQISAIEKALEGLQQHGRK